MTLLHEDGRSETVEVEGGTMLKDFRERIKVGPDDWGGEWR